MLQARAIIYDDLAKFVTNMEAICRMALQRLHRESGETSDWHRSPSEQCYDVLSPCWTEWQSADPDFGSQDMRFRLSLLELLMADVEKDLRSPFGEIDLKLDYLASANRRPYEDPRRQALSEGIDELNQRFRLADLHVHYHGGKLQLIDEDKTQTEIHEPLWRLIAGPKWSNVAHDMQVALDHRDNNRDDPALYAMMALESAIKIISDEKGWTQGKENGAANFIDNLASQKNGRFIDAWESEHLKKLFSEIRNPHGHGSGSAPPPSLSPQQTAWAIDTAMTWIKSLVSRM